MVNLQAIAETFVSLVFILYSSGTQVQRLLFVDFLGYCHYCRGIGVHLLPLNNAWSYWLVVFQLLFHCTLVEETTPQATSNDEEYEKQIQNSTRKTKTNGLKIIRE
ncbi:hypothetical protein ACTFIU_003079 [Dictyostelium citrinum]